MYHRDPSVASSSALLKTSNNVIMERFLDDVYRSISMYQLDKCDDIENGESSSQDKTNNAAQPPAFSQGPLNFNAYAPITTAIKIQESKINILRHCNQSRYVKAFILPLAASLYKYEGNLMLNNLSAIESIFTKSNYWSFIYTGAIVLKQYLDPLYPSDIKFGEIKIYTDFSSLIPKPDETLRPFDGHARHSTRLFNSMQSVSDAGDEDEEVATDDMHDYLSPTNISSSHDIQHAIPFEINSQSHNSSIYCITVTTDSKEHYDSVKAFVNNFRSINESRKVADSRPRNEAVHLQYLHKRKLKQLVRDLRQHGGISPPILQTNHSNEL